MQGVSKTPTGGAMCQLVNNPLQPKKEDNEASGQQGNQVKNLTPYTKCPNCDHWWCSQEIEFQACDNCGYPLHKEQDNRDQIFDFSNGDYLH